MIGFFIKAGDVEVGNAFSPYANDFRSILKEFIKRNIYGRDIDLILIEYHLEGKFLQIPEKEYKFVSYRKKEKSVSVAVYVAKSFKLLTEYEKRVFITRTTTNAVLLIKEKIQKKIFFDFDFEKFQSDLEKCSDTFLSSVSNEP